MDLGWTKDGHRMDMGWTWDGYGMDQDGPGMYLGWTWDGLGSQDHGMDHGTVLGRPRNGHGTEPWDGCWHGPGMDL